MGKVILVQINDALLTAAKRTLSRQGRKPTERNATLLLRQWAEQGLIKVAGDANVHEHRAQAIDRINARDAADLARRGFAAQVAVDAVIASVERSDPDLGRAFQRQIVSDRQRCTCVCQGNDPTVVCACYAEDMQ